MRVRKISPKILQLLTEWTETFPYDFRDERMMRSLKELTHRLASGDEVSPCSFYFFMPLIIDVQQKQLFIRSELSPKLTHKLI